MRALAVLAVVAFHYSLATPLATRASNLGWIGVDLFFVLSGYLITTILLESRSRPGYFATFYARRTLRIFPIYFLLLAGYIVAARVFGGPQPWAYWGMHAAFVSSTVEHFHSWNFAAPAWVYGGATVLWSLSIEEQFYLFWAPVVRWLRPAALWVVLGVAVIGAPWLRFNIHTQFFPEYRFLPARCDTLAWGALLALALQQWRREPAALRRWLAGAGGAAALAVGALLVGTGGRRESLAFATWGYSALALAFAAAVGTAVLTTGRGGLAGRALRCRTVRYVGKISYTTYLVHYPILLLVGGWLAFAGHGTGGVLLRNLASLAATLALAAASWRWLEAPILRFKDRWAP
ncbi:MAG: acyltransferase family protein, partial [Streptosporangiaceae bacterium]